MRYMDNGQGCLRKNLSASWNTGLSSPLLFGTLQTLNCLRVR